MSAGRVQVTVNNLTYHITLKEGKLAEKVASMLPFTLNCTRGLEQEYYGELPQKTKRLDCQPTSDGHKNCLYYFEPWNALSMLFKDADTRPYEIFHIGDFEEDISTFLKSQGNHLTMSFTAI